MRAGKERSSAATTTAASTEATTPTISTAAVSIFDAAASQAATTRNNKSSTNITTAAAVGVMVDPGMVLTVVGRWWQRGPPQENGGMEYRRSYAGKLGSGGRFTFRPSHPPCAGSYNYDAYQPILPYPVGNSCRDMNLILPRGAISITSWEHAPVLPVMRVHPGHPMTAQPRSLGSYRMPDH